MKDPASAIGERVANRLIESEDWAREKMRAHAGRSFLLRVGPVATSFLIRDDGTIDALPARGTAPDLELSLSPFQAPAFLAHPERWDALVTSSGNVALATTLRELATTLPWFVERAFARAFGPIVGQRLADTGRTLLGFPDYAAGRLAEHAFSYARNETDTLARGDEARAMALEAEAVAARVDVLAERIAGLETPPQTIPVL